MKLGIAPAWANGSVQGERNGLQSEPLKATFTRACAEPDCLRTLEWAKWESFAEVPSCPIHGQQDSWVVVANRHDEKPVIVYFVRPATDALGPEGSALLPSSWTAVRRAAHSETQKARRNERARWTTERRAAHSEVQLARYAREGPMDPERRAALGAAQKAGWARRKDRSAASTPERRVAYHAALKAFWTSAAREAHGATIKASWARRKAAQS